MTAQNPAAAVKAKLYVNLITSGLGLTAPRLQALVAAGLDHIQLSFQDVDADAANRWAGTRAHAHKLQVAEMIKQYRVGFTVNLVVHRNNIDRLALMIAMAEQLRADKLEIANVQYYGWALRNREALLPSRQQLRDSLAIIEAAQERMKGRMRIEFVLPDYYAKYPKPCMGGWGNSLMLIDPAGFAMPCHAAGVIPGMQFDSVRNQSLQFIWEQSESFTRFRGEDWMQEPCRSCDRRTVDFGGCRCQALQLTGDAAATDPVCSLSPDRGLVLAAIEEAQTAPLLTIAGAAIRPSNELIYRIDPV